MPDVAMPRLSDSMEEGTILKWLKSDGDEVAKGEELVEIETDKANMTYEADESGTLSIVAEEGDTLSVGETICPLGEGGGGSAGAGDEGEAGGEEPAGGQTSEGDDGGDDADASGGEKEDGAAGDDADDAAAEGDHDADAAAEGGDAAEADGDAAEAD